MRLKTRTWYLISVVLFILAAFLWWLGDRVQTPKTGPASATNGSQPANPAASSASTLTKLLTQLPATSTAISPAVSRSPAAAPAPSPSTPAPAAATARPIDKNNPHRLANTIQPLQDLLRNDNAILLRNAFLDSSLPGTANIPEHLRATTPPGAYIVQSRGVITDAFRQVLASAGAEIISYVPNNAYLVRMADDQAGQLNGRAPVQSVLPYEPYYKLEAPLLDLAVNQQDLPADALLRVTLFPGQTTAGASLIGRLGGEVLDESRSPFGPLWVVKVPAGRWLDLAQSPAVQELEKVYARQPANDLARTRVGISQDTVATTNFLGLTGSNVLVNLNDAGVDATHPDLVNRVLALSPADLVDSNGHGTHVAGIIAGDGSKSDTITNAPGSVTNASFRGMAPAAKLFALTTDLNFGPAPSDTFLQQEAAKTNALISNNSWNYVGESSYDTAAASYDAAVRDALPQMTGAQAIVYVFAAGNQGSGTDNGNGGEPDTILSPATAKNVITVGALEQPRNITNEIHNPDPNDPTNTIPSTPWLNDTDSDNQVAAYSSRGNVGVGTEGDFGRLKPDVVAPGTFVLSTRAAGWYVPQQAAITNVNYFANQLVTPGTLDNYSMYIPPNALGFQIYLSPTPRYADVWTGLPIYLRKNDFPSTTVYDARADTVMSLPQNYPISEGDWYYSVGNDTGDYVGYNVQTLLLLTNIPHNYFEVLSNINDSIAPSPRYYRFDSGTSMSAPVVSGMLALMREYFEQRIPAALQRTNSPALMKALLINGARSVSERYTFSTTKTLNPQGWGLVNLTNSLPIGMLGGDPTNSPIQFVDQSVTNALATGESRTWNLNLSTNAQFGTLRVTLVWTDPPGNPNTSAKLVNDLDLIVTNLDSHEIYLGNDIPYGSDYSRPWAGVGLAPTDLINNVENVFLPSLLATNYSVTVRARRVNVNAVTTDTNRVAQDYALVVSVDLPQLTNAFSLTSAVDTNVALRPLIQLTNGLPLLGQRVAANSPLINGSLGQTSQWNFYVFTNRQMNIPEVTLTNGSNVAFITFLPPNLSNPRNTDADIDIYVSTNSAITNLDPGAIAEAYKSTNRGGDEVIAFTDAALDAVYYVGVKSEDQQGSEFALMTISSDRPFEEDFEGSRILHGYPWYVPIPDGSPGKPGGCYVFAVCIRKCTVGSVVITNMIAHQNFGDLIGSIQHGKETVVLNNHSLNNGFYNTTTNPFTGLPYWTFIYDDSNEGKIPYAITSDGPGKLTAFANQNPIGVWRLTMVDNALGSTGRVERMDIRLYPEQGMGGLAGIVNPNSWEYYFLDIISDATNFTITVEGLDPALPLNVYIRAGDLPDGQTYDKRLLIDPTLSLSNYFTISYSIYDSPPLNPGRYYVGVFNPNSVSVEYKINAQIDYSAAGSVLRSYVAQDTPRPIADDALTRSTNFVDLDRAVADVRVGIRVDHPRPSDLVFHLVSPEGTRLLLMENRGETMSGGLGTGYAQTGINYLIFTENTNLADTLIKFAPPPFTNNLRLWTNRYVLFDGFENALAINYPAGAGFFAGGWFLNSGSVNILRSGFNGLVTIEGLQCLDLNGTGPGDISTNVPTIPGKRYSLTYNFTRNPESIAAGVVPEAVLTINNTPYLTNRPNYVNTFAAPNWQSLTAPIEFTALGNSTKIGFTTTTPGSAGVLLDKIQIAELESGYFYYPEESLTLFNGEHSLGNWVLEVTDARAGAVVPDPILVSWELQMTFAIPGQRAIPLFHGISYTGTVKGIDTAYFSVDVPRAARVATNELLSITGDGNLTMFYSVNGLPVGDVTVDAAFVNLLGQGNSVNLVLTTNFPTTAPLPPGGRYYLAVRNQSSDVTNTFRLTVWFDRLDSSNLPPITTLTNRIPYTNTIAATNVMDYYQFNVSSNSMTVRFDLFPIDGNVNLYVRKARNILDPLPTFTQFDYLSDMPDLFTDTVFIDRSSTVALTPGVWYLGVYNAEDFPVEYSIMATELTNSAVRVVMLTNGVPFIGYAQPGNVINTVYGLAITDTNSVARFQLHSFSGNADLILRRSAFPTLTNYEAFSFNFGTNDDNILISTNPPANVVATNLNGVWYVAVPNSGAIRAYFALTAIVTPNFINLVDGVPRTNTVKNSAQWQYYRFEVDPNAALVQFIAAPTNGDIVLLISKDRGQAQAWPTPASYEIGSDIPGTNTEEIILHSNSLPALSPGTWYVAVGTKTTNPVNYTLTARQYFQSPAIHLLTNSVAFTNQIQVGSLMDYYQFNVSNRATLVVFEILQTDGNIDLYLKKGLPLPNLTNFAYASTNPVVKPEAILVGTNSTPVAISPGNWYLGITNLESHPVNYTVRVTEYYFKTVNYTRLINTVWYRAASIPGPIPTNYFYIQIGPTNPVARFYLDNSSGNGELILQKDSPPNAYSYDVASTNALNTDGMIVIRADNGIADLNLPSLEGTWYAAVLSRNGKPVSFRIRAVVIPPYVTLTNGVPYTFTNAPGSGWTYYQYLASSNATALEFDAVPLTGNVDIFAVKIQANDEPLPTVSAFDYDSASVHPGIIPEQIILFTNSVPPLTPGLWWLGVLNPDDVPATYTVTAREFITPIPSIVELTNTIAFTNSISTNQAAFYSFDVVSNLFVTFDLFGLDGNADLFVRRGLPLPNAADFDYAGTRPQTNAEQISVDSLSQPVALNPGLWFLMVTNVDSNTVHYTIRATEITNFTANIIPLTNNVPLAYQSNPGGFNTNFFLFQVTNSSSEIRFILDNLTGNGDLVVRRGDFPSVFIFDYRSQQPGTNLEFISIRTNAALPSLNGNWYVAVVNREATNIQYTLRAVAVPRIVPLQDAHMRYAPVLPGWDYYSFNVSSNATMVEVDAVPSNGDIRLYLRQDQPIANFWPTLTDYDYLSDNPGIAPEQVVLFKNSMHIPMAGVWYIGIYNPSSNAINYSIIVNQFFTTNVVIPAITNGQTITNTIVDTNGVDYYQFMVSSNAVKAVFETLNADGNVDLYVRRGLPLPGPNNSDYESVNGGATNELITVLTNSTPIALQPGLWFIAVSNAQGAPVTYSFKAAEFLAATNTPLIINPAVSLSNGIVTLRWTAILGATYSVEGKTNLQQTNWMVFGTNIFATNVNMVYTFQKPNSTMAFFRVVQLGLPSAPEVVINKKIVINNGVLTLSWSSEIGAHYYIQAVTNIVSTNWLAFSPTIIAVDITTSYDIELAKLNPTNLWFFRIVKGDSTITNTVPPIPVTFLLPGLSFASNQFTLTWTASPNLRFQVQYATNMPPAWQTITNVITSSTTDYFYIDAPLDPVIDPQRFYRILRLP